MEGTQEGAGCELQRFGPAGLLCSPHKVSGAPAVAGCTRRHREGADSRVVLGARWLSADCTANLSGLGVLFY